MLIFWEILRICYVQDYRGAHYKLENLKSWISPKIFAKSIFFWKHASKMLLFRFLWYVSDLYGLSFLVKKIDLKIVSFCPIVKFMISLYKLNTRGAGQISFQKLWNFGKSFSWHRHSICLVVLPTNPQFESISPGYFPSCHPAGWGAGRYGRVGGRCQRAGP